MTPRERQFVRFEACNAFVLSLQLAGHRLKLPFKPLKEGNYYIKPNDGDDAWTVIYIPLPLKQQFLPLYEPTEQKTPAVA